jgi:hypothetical protein
MVLVSAAAATAAPADVVHACSLLSKAEVKKIVPWPDFLDQMPVNEEAIAGGTACNYPTVHVQVMTNDPGRWKGFVNALKNSPMETIPGVGDEAYLRDNKGYFAEFVARVGGQILTIQRSLDSMQGMTMEKAKPGIIELAEAYVAKLRG